MLGSLELLAAGACMGGSMTGFAVSRDREPASAYTYNLIMMVIGTLAASLAFMHRSAGVDTIYLAAAALIAGSLAVAAIRAFATRQHSIGVYLAALSTAVAFALSQTLSSAVAVSSTANLMS